MKPTCGTDDAQPGDAAPDVADEEKENRTTKSGKSGVPSPPEINRPVHRFYPNPSDS